MPSNWTLFQPPSLFQLIIIIIFLSTTFHQLFSFVFFFMNDSTTPRIRPGWNHFPLFISRRMVFQRFGNFGNSRGLSQVYVPIYGVVENLGQREIPPSRFELLLQSMTDFCTTFCVIQQIFPPLSFTHSSHFLFILCYILAHNFGAVGPERKQQQPRRKMAIFWFRHNHSKPSTFQQA